MPEVIMPKMGDAMEAGTLSSWLKHEGDQVEVGDVLAEIETDKATMELEAEDAGVLTRVIAGEGDEVAVGEPIAVISADGEVPDAAPDEARQGAEETADSAGGRETAETEAAETETAKSETAETKAAKTETAESETAGTKAAETKAAATETAESGEQGARARGAEEQKAATSGPERSADGRVRASPVVRRLAREHGIELAGISGSGPDGRVVERDVRAALERAEKGAREPSAQAPADAAPAGDGSTASVTAPAPSGAAATELLPLSRTQRVVGERMQQAWQAPHHYATVEVHVDELLALRGQLNQALADEAADGSGDGPGVDAPGVDGPADGPVRLSINDFVMKACALALRTFPKLNSWWTAEGIELHQRVDLAMAVALEDGLITPVIRNAAERPLSAISTEAKELAARARSGKLRPDEYQGGTFTVSNMGMYGVESFTAIINPPSVSIVAVSAVARRPDFDAAGDLVPRSVLKLTVGSDHRVVNGAENARYLAEVKRLLEHPLLLTV
jgi:pyruvate dehydrogenase E2 component (dihydrolipoamide acetyltransferase)